MRWKEEGYTASIGNQILDCGIMESVSGETILDIELPHKSKNCEYTLMSCPSQ